MLDRKDSVGDCFSNTSLLKKSNDHCLSSDLYWTRFVFAAYLVPNSVKKEVSFYGHIFRDLVLVIATLIFF